jgi:hypothetical protein
MGHASSMVSRKASGCRGVICPQAMRTALTRTPVNSSYITTPDQVPFLLAHATPYAMHLAGLQCERQAFRPDRAPCANRLRFCYLLQHEARSGRGDRKEEVGIAGPAGGSGPPVCPRSQLPRLSPFPGFTGLTQGCQRDAAKGKDRPVRGMNSGSRRSEPAASSRQTIPFSVRSTYLGSGRLEAGNQQWICAGVFRILLFERFRPVSAHIACKVDGAPSAIGAVTVLGAPGGKASPPPDPGAALQRINRSDGVGLPRRAETRNMRPGSCCTPFQRPQAIFPAKRLSRWPPGRSC